MKEDDGVAPSESVCVGVPVSVLPNDGEYVYPSDGDAVIELVREVVFVKDGVCVREPVCELDCVEELDGVSAADCEIDIVVVGVEVGEVDLATEAVLV